MFETTDWMWSYITREMADLCQEMNPRFDRNRFMDAAGYTEHVKKVNAQ